MSKIGYLRRAYLYRKAENDPPQQTKLRHCLKCQAPFESAWSGERVCPKCKTSRDWRDGDALNMASWSPVVMKRILAAIDELLSEERPEDTKVH